MAIFQKAYQGYDGQLRPPSMRWWVIFRYAVNDLFQSRMYGSRLFTAFYVLCFVPTFALMGIIYARNNVEMLFDVEIPGEEIFSIDAEFFLIWMQGPHLFMIMALVIIVGPALISPDMRNNAMPLYLSRSISKSSYIGGKLLVLIALGSTITWIPGLLLIFFQASMADTGWFTKNQHLPFAAAASSLLAIVCLSMLSLAVSACVQWKAIARLTFFGIVFILSAFSKAVQQTIDGWAANIFSLLEIADALVSQFYGVNGSGLIPLPVAITMVVIVTTIAAIILVRRIRAYEVVA